LWRADRELQHDAVGAHCDARRLLKRPSIAQA
jgi:hypothetical protein